MELTKSYSDIAEYGEKCRFYHNFEDNTVVCTTFYKGRTIRGIAKCDPEDDFNLEVGKKLAYLRCRQKFAIKKCERAHKVCDDAFVAVAQAQNNLYRACEFVEDAEMQLEDINKALIDFESKLGIMR